MPQFSVPTGSLSRPIASLGQALFGDTSEGTIQGQLDGALFNQRQAAAGLDNTRADRVVFDQAGAETVRNFLTSVGGDYSPDMLGPLLGGALTMGVDPRQGLQAALGAANAIDPGMYTEDQFSRAFQGAGVINDYADTPSGFSDQLGWDQQVHHNEMMFDYDRLEQDGMLERREQDMRYPGSTPGGPIGIETATQLSEMFQSQMLAAGLELDEEEALAAGQRVRDLYSTRPDAGSAIYQTIQEFRQAEEMAAQNRSGGLFGLGATTPSSLDYLPFEVGSLGQAIAPGGATPGAEAPPQVDQQVAMQAWSATSSAPPQEGDTLRDETGRPVYTFSQGMWAPFMASAVAATTAAPPPPPTLRSPDEFQYPGVDSSLRGSRRERRDQQVVQDAPRGLPGGRLPQEQQRRRSS